jgi:hypothetical protein
MPRDRVREEVTEGSNVTGLLLTQTLARTNVHPPREAPCCVSQAQIPGYWMLLDSWTFDRASFCILVVA